MATYRTSPATLSDSEFFEAVKSLDDVPRLLRRVPSWDSIYWDLDMVFVRLHKLEEGR